MGNVICKKSVCFLLLILTTTLLLAAYAGIFCIKYAKSNPDVRLMRVSLNSIVNAAENGTLKGFKNDCYTLFGLDGTVIAANRCDYQIGEKIDLHTLSGINEIAENGQKSTVDFISPVIINGKQTGTLLVTVKKTDFEAGLANRILPLLPIVFLIVAVCTLLIFLFRLIKNDLLAPSTLLHEATKNILKGDLSTKLSYDYDGEAGALCHDFEAMRDELESGARREKQMLDNEKLLLTCISHDLKTPLAAISGYAEEIRDGFADSQEKMNRNVGMVLKKVQVLSKLIDDILDHSKTELHEFSIEKQELYSFDYFSDVLGDISLDLACSGISFKAGEIPNVLIEIDAKRIFQVLQNIISNSVKYTKKGGLIEVSFTVSEKELIVSIKDNGEGIAAGDLPFIFDKFYRGEKARTQNIPGSGLGLNIAKYIVENHGGRIECDSVLYAGTTISFSLPIL
jgi:signal transduction histidine kinase